MLQIELTCITGAVILQSCPEMRGHAVALPIPVSYRDSESTRTSPRWTTGEQRRYRERNARIRELRHRGWTMAQIGAHFALSAPRVFQICYGRRR
jgi:hypothetical protein